MPRTSVQTLSFVQEDVGMFDDPKMVDLNDQWGPLGETIFNRTLTIIAKTEGYYALFNEQFILSIYRSVGSKWIKNRAVVAEVIHYCGACGLFDVNLLTQNVITSRGIQRRWLYAKQKSRARGYSTAKYWLLDDDAVLADDCNNDESDSNNADNCDNNNDNCSNNSPYISKVKESKVKESERGDKPPTPRFVKPTLEEVADYCKERNNSIDPEKFICYYESKGWLVGKTSMKDWKAAVMTWEKQNFESDRKPKPKPQRNYDEE